MSDFIIQLAKEFKEMLEKIMTAEKKEYLEKNRQTRKNGLYLIIILRFT